jgi:hypothetical protein
MSWRTQGRQRNGWFGNGKASQVSHARDAGGDGTRLVTSRNISDLARIIETEARGQSAEAKRAVGAVALNRARRNGVSLIQDVFRGFRYHIEGGEDSRGVASDLLTGRIVDPTGGATHFYTPRIMPKEGEPTGGRDVRGGLEIVPGVVDRYGRPVRSYRPRFAAEFEPVTVPGIPPAIFKFYRQPGHGHVR